MIRYQVEELETKEVFTFTTNVSEEYFLEETVPDFNNNGCLLLRWAHVENSLDEPEEYIECDRLNKCQ